MKAEFEQRACQLLRAADIFRGIQYLFLLVGMVCSRLFGNGAGIILLFVQCVAAIIFLIVFSWKSDTLIRPRYPQLEPLRYKGGRPDEYTPALRNHAILSDDDLTVKLLEKPRPIMFRAFILLVIMAAFDPLLSRTYS